MSEQPWILIVDDDADVQAALAELISMEGYNVEVAANGAEAIELVDDRPPPCAIILDLLMPGIVGTELLEYMQAEKRLQHVPVAIVSGSPQLAPEGYPVFPKPISSRSVLDFVRRRC